MSKHLPLSKDFLKKRGYCCHEGCLNCPYGEEDDAKGSKKIDPSIPLEFQVRKDKKYVEEMEIEQEILNLVEKYQDPIIPISMIFSFAFLGSCLIWYSIFNASPFGPIFC